MSKRVIVAIMSIAGCSAGHEESSGTTLGGGPVANGDGDTAPDAAVPDPIPDADFAFFPARANATRAPNDTFASESAVYLSSIGTGAVEGDYYFRVTALVTTPGGNDLFIASNDPDECRRFHVAASGAIDLVYAAGGCEHVDSGAFAVQVMPFTDISSIVLVDAEGRRGYNLEVAPYAGNFYGETATHLRFHVAEAPVCGDGIVQDGEKCDDGNTAYNDGCSGTCTIEHLCCCGNGEVEPGETCDDGNHVDGDGCSTECAVE